MFKRIKNCLVIRKDGVWNYKRVIIFSIVLLIVIGSSASYAKYAYLDIKNYYLEMKGFYFNCDKLSNKGANIEMTNWSGVGDYEITFNMDSLSNRNLKNSDDVYYDISYECSSNVVCSIKDNKTSGMIPHDSNQDSFTVVITVPASVTLHDKDSVTLKVVATSTSPYRKKLVGSFKLVVGYYGLSYEISDKVGSPYLEAKVTNTLDYYVVREAFSNYKVNTHIDIPTYLGLDDLDKKKCSSAIITFDFNPDYIILDMTDEAYLSGISSSTKRIGNYDYINSLSFSIDALSSMQVKFYKKDTKLNYTYPNIDNNSIIKVSYS